MSRSWEVGPVEVVVARIAGLDVHKDTVMVCVRTPGPVLENVVRGVDEVEDLAHAHVGDSLVDDSLTSTGVTPTVSAAPSMTRYSLSA